MFGKKKVAIIEIGDDYIKGKNIKGRTVGELITVIKLLAHVIEEETGIKSYEILTKCIFEIIETP